MIGQKPRLLLAASAAVIATGAGQAARAQNAAGSPATAQQQKPAGDDAQTSSSPLATQPTSNNSTANGPEGSNATAATGVPTQGQSGDIVVTAQRREQRLQEAPVAVTALSAGALAQLNVSNTQDLMQVVPSLQVSTQTAGDGGGSATFFLRGMGQQRSGNGSEPAVGIYVDDFYYPSLSGTVFDIVDLADLEVLRGPQGTLFGRNTIGGAIRYTTRGAEVGRFSGHITGTLGDYARRDVSGAVNVPVGDFAAIRITGGHLERNGFVRIQTTGRRAGDTTTDLARVQARIQPTSDIYVDLSGQYSKFHLFGFTYDVPGPLTPVPPAAGQSATLPFIYNTRVAPARGLPLYTNAFASTCYYCQYGTPRSEFSETKYKNALATIGWSVTPTLSIKSLTGWQQVDNRASNDLDSSPAPIFQGGITRARTNAFSQELQLNGNKLLGDRLNFVAGGFYYNQRDPGLLPEAPNFTLGNPSVSTPSTRTVKSYAGFIDGSFKLLDKLTLLGGFRYSSDDKTLVVTTAAGAPIANVARSFHSNTYRGGLQYQWTPDIMTYANVSSGFRGGGFNPYSATQNPTIRAFDPEKATSYEAGARLQFLDRRITINPTAFYVDWNNIQVQSASPNQTTGQADITLQNAGKARSYGFELEYTVGVSDHVRLFGNMAYLNLRYTNLGNASGITLNSDFQRAPPITFSVGAAHTLDVGGSGAKIVSTINYSFEDDQRSTPTDADALLLHAYGLLNGRI
ncbi:TonB-dependent receptor [Sphingomonas bacterium]|uniref:TonB-dependent receptor n=1 Tax=Sphingomonas bacterium TaxID=1895847 RepID=UPI001575695C|nr:TonB-dependent receptor [Sphingomonas bacterium]